MEEVRVQDRVGLDPNVPRAVGPEIKDPQKAQEAPVEQVSKKVEQSVSDAAVISQSLKREFTKVSSGTKVSFSATSPEDASKGKINFIVLDKASGEVVRSFPDEGQKNSDESTKVSATALLDQLV